MRAAQVLGPKHEISDYYKTHGVERDASVENIKKAFRRLVRKHHPDLHKSPDVQVKIQEINEANDALSDKEKRLAYDSMARRQATGQEFSTPPGWADGFEFSDRTPMKGEESIISITATPSSRLSSR